MKYGTDVPRGVLMKTNTSSGWINNRKVLSIGVVLLLGFFLMPNTYQARSAEKMGNELAIVQVIREGPHETVVIVNLTREKIDLCGYVLKADRADLSFDFAEEADCKATIAPLSLIRVHSGSGSSEYYASWEDIPWSQGEIWNDQSDKATLVDPDGNTISTFSYGEDYE